MKSSTSATSTTDAERFAIEQYFAEGTKRAAELGNRGPVRFVGDGALHPDIVEAYWDAASTSSKGSLANKNWPISKPTWPNSAPGSPPIVGAETNSVGGTAIGADLEARTVVWAKTLSDPVGGTQANHGRHPVKMSEPEAPANAPDEVVYVVLGSLQFSDACLRAYAHPDLLGIAAALNGADFTPFNEALFLKDPFVGPSVAWHRDGVTHWDSPEWDQGSHGFNFMGQVHGCTPANGLWVLPGTHKQRNVDIAALVEAAGSDRLPEAVPVICEPGDVCITNRQAIHGSFANTSPEARVTINMGFHRRSAVLGQVGSGIHGAVGPLDESRVATRSRVIGIAQAARHAHYPDESPFDYEPLRGQTFVWDEAARAELVDYNLLDLSI